VDQNREENNVKKNFFPLVRAGSVVYCRCCKNKRISPFNFLCNLEWEQQFRDKE
jgi:hypothetical protein